MFQNRKVAGVAGGVLWGSQPVHLFRGLSGAPDQLIRYHTS